jgi:hypothetical protein
MFKILAVVFMISVLSFNWYGYDLLVKVLEIQYDEELELALDNNDYDTSQIIELDSKVILPYVADWKDFERVDGEVMIDGVYYKFVERKYENGRIIYRCIPNTNKIKLHHARSTFYQLMNEIQDSPVHQKNQKGPLAAKKTITDYDLIKGPKLTFSIQELFNTGYFFHSLTTTDPGYGISSPPPEYV